MKFCPLPKGFCGFLKTTTSKRLGSAMPPRYFCTRIRSPAKTAGGRPGPASSGVSKKHIGQRSVSAARSISGAASATIG